MMAGPAASIDEWLTTRVPSQREVAIYEVQGKAQTKFDHGSTSSSFVLKTTAYAKDSGSARKRSVGTRTAGARVVQRHQRLP